MIRIEAICAHSGEPRTHDAKAPCDSTRNRSLAVDVCGTFDDARRAIVRQAQERGWKLTVIPTWGRKKGYVCPNCQRRAAGEI